MELKNVDKLPIDIKEAIKKRISTRTYEEKSLTKVDKNKLMDFNRTLSNPFGVDVKVQYISKDKGAELRESWEKLKSAAAEVEEKIDNA